MACGIYTALLVTLAWVMIQICWMHVRPARSRIGAMTAGYLISLPCVYAVYAWLPCPAWIAAVCDGEAWGNGLLHAYLLHLLLFFCYAECFYHVERAVTMRILIEIARHGDQGCALADVRQEYDLNDMVTRRLEVLGEHDFVERRGDRWHLKPKGRFFARAMPCSGWIYQSQGQRDAQ